MRSACLFPAIAAVGLVSVTGIVHVVAFPVMPVIAGYVAGVVFTIAASIVVNSCNAARYGRCVWDEDRHSDFDDVDAGSPWGESQRAGYHVAGMRLDRVRRHPEAPATFPAGEPQ